MDIKTLPSGTTVFIDANIFIYHFGGVSQECSEFLQRIEDGELIGYVSIIVLAEILHRRMMAEAVDKGLVTPQNVLKKLKQKPEIIKGLTQYAQDVENILKMPLKIITISVETIMKSCPKRSSFGLFTNDSLNLVCMEEKGISDLVTRDDDFDKVSGIRVWKPTDI